MSTTTETSPLDLPIPSDELLRKFCCTNPEYHNHDRFKDLILSWSYRGDFTETGDRRLRESMGDEAYEHLHYDTLACNGHILIEIPRYKHPEITEKARGGIGAPAEWHWCMSDTFERKSNVWPAPPSLIACVSKRNQEELACLPGLEYVRIEEVRYFQGGKRKTQAPPMEVIFFRFDRGVGCVVVSPVNS